ncbi:MAG: tRNA dihydrouridine synthase DusB [Candidatus Micrarchaeota archaeon]|nr:tRNA dihydrouridine synthase DusB [Candidatus Micrarchaeota archaeon]
MKKFPKLSGKAMLAPMAGVTDVAFRALAKRYGAALTYTEFVSSAAIVRGSEKTLGTVKRNPSERPCAVQLFGNNKEEIVAAARALEMDFDIIDINCGCPVHKVIKTGAGSALLSNPRLIGELVEELISAVNKPVTVKIRAGIDEKRINAVEVANIAEEAGAAAITVHGRTQKQGYSGKADWDIIKEVKESVSIPVIGNGDITSPEIFKARLEESGVDYIMMGRVAMKNPFIFRQINDYLETGFYTEKPPLEQFSEYLEIAEKCEIPFIQIKNHAMWLTKGIKGGRKLRERVSTTKNLAELEKIIGVYKLTTIKGTHISSFERPP